MKWHNIEERRCSLDLQGTRRCPQEISDAKHTIEMWEDVHRRGQCHADFIPNSLQLSFSTTMIFEHHVVSNWLILSNACQSKGSQKHIDDLWKTLQVRLAILLLFMWLNLVKNTKLPMYPEEGSSHYVVQQTFFFLDDFFLDDFFFFLVILFFFCVFFLFVFFYTKGRDHVCNPRLTTHDISWVPIAQ